MKFYVTFGEKARCSININHQDNANLEAYLLVEDVVLLIHDICDDLDMVRPHDMENLKYAIDRFNYLTKVENNDN